MARKSETKSKSKKHVAHLEQVHRQERGIQIGAIVVFAIVLLLVFYAMLIGPYWVEPNRPVASVNGEWVTVRTFQVEAKMERFQLVQQYGQYLQYAQMFGIADPSSDPNFASALQGIQSQLDPATLGRQALDRAIDNKLIIQEAKKRNIVINPQDVDKLLQEEMGYYANGTLTPTNTLPPTVVSTLDATQLALVTLSPTPGTVIPTDTTAPTITLTPSITSTLDPSITPTITETPTITITPTITETPTVTIAPTSTVTPGPSPTITSTFTPLPTETPLTLQGFQDLYKKQVDSFNTSAHMSESDLRSYFEGLLYHQKLQDLVMTGLEPVEEQVWARHILVKTEDEAKKVLERLKNGEDFSKVAAEVSIDTSNKDKGGDLGWFGQDGTMVKEFEDAAFALKVGELSQPVQTTYGYHIIQILGREKRHLTDDQFQKLKNATFTNFVKGLRDAAKVEEYDLWKEVVPTEPALPTPAPGAGGQLPTGP